MIRIIGKFSPKSNEGDVGPGKELREDTPAFRFELIQRISVKKNVPPTARALAFKGEEVNTVVRELLRTLLEADQAIDVFKVECIEAKIVGERKTQVHSFHFLAILWA
jgi:hypothetical protein